MRIGVLTGGGDCPGLNAAIRAVTKALVWEHGAEVVGVEDGFAGLVEGRRRPLGPRDVAGLLTRGGTVLGASNRSDPFAYGPAGADRSADALAHAADLDALVVIGGDGTLAGAQALAACGLPVVGLPKTIDNDVRGTERTVGFDTAVATATDALDRLHTTAQSHRRVLILETMGRYAGWLALWAGAASGADVILLPERPYALGEVARVCQLRERGGQRFTLIAVAEGARPEGGALSVRDVVAGSPDPVRLGGAGAALAAALADHVEGEVRVAVLGHVQRGGPPSAADRVLATLLGARAAAGRSDVMVGVQADRLVEVPLAVAAAGPRSVGPDDALARAVAAVGVSFGAGRDA